MSLSLWICGSCVLACVGSCAAATLSSSFSSHIRGTLEPAHDLHIEKPWQNSSVDVVRLEIAGLTTMSPQRHNDSHSHPSLPEHSHGEEHAAGGCHHGLGYSLCLFGAVAFNMSLLYLINHDDPGILLATWQVLSMTLSIFIAVMAYATVREIFVDPFISRGPYSLVIASQLLFISIYVGNEMVLYFLKSPEYQEILHSGAALGCHVLGFAACYSFADMQRAAVFGNTIFGSLLVVALAALVLIAFAYVARRVHLWVEHLHQAEREHLADLRWEREVELAEDEAVSLCMGFLVVQAAAFAIRGTHKSIDAYSGPDNVTQSQAYAILICGGVFTVAAALGLCFVNYYMKRAIQRRHSFHGHTRRVDTLNFEQFASENEVPVDVRVMMIVLHTLSVAMAWCVLLFAEWQVYALGFEGSRISACMLVALTLTLAAFAMIFVLDHIANHLQNSMQRGKYMDPNKVFRSMTLALGIVIGFAWERSFHVGLHDIAHAFSFTHAMEDHFSHLMACALIVIVAPAWAMYVFPMVEQSRELCDVKQYSPTASQTASQANMSPQITC